MDAKHRRNLKIQVAIMHGLGSVAMQLTGSSYQGCPDIPIYTHKRGKQDVQYVSFSASEYTTNLEGAMELYKGRKRTVGILGIVQDRASQHTAKLTAAWSKRKDFPLITLSPRSPDLDPLDYGIFANFKRQLFKDRREYNWQWDQMCAEAMRRLGDLDVQQVNRTIEELPLRMQACIEANGEHIDNALIQLKKSR